MIESYCVVNCTHLLTSLCEICQRFLFLEVIGFVAMNAGMHSLSPVLTPILPFFVDMHRMAIWRTLIRWSWSYILHKYLLIFKKNHKIHHKISFKNILLKFFYLNREVPCEIFVVKNHCTLAICMSAKSRKVFGKT